MNDAWIDYDPSWLVALAREQQPDLVEALARCTKALVESRAYIYFVPAVSPNQQGSEWQFARNVMLEDRVNGTVVLDILRDGRVGGVEFLARL